MHRFSPFVKGGEKKKTCVYNIILYDVIQAILVYISGLGVDVTIILRMEWRERIAAAAGVPDGSTLSFGCKKKKAHLTD